MIDSWSDYIFAGLIGVAFLCAWASGDRHLRSGFLVLFAAYTASMIGEGLINLRASVVKELIINVFVVVAFFRIADSINYSRFLGAWPHIILMIECGIFLSHLSKFSMGPLAYIWIVNCLFALELVVLIVAALPKTAENFSTTFRSWG